jgi:hypothetical protein
MEAFAGFNVFGRLLDLLLEPAGERRVALSQLVDEECHFGHG